MKQSDQVASVETAFTPFKLGRQTLRNRFIKAATYEGMSPNGMVSDALIAFHEDIAAGGVAMTTVAYGAVHPDGRTHADQLLVSRANHERLKELTQTVHSQGALASIQLTHCGYFTRNKKLSTPRPLSSSRTFNSYGVMSGLAFSQAMTKIDISAVCEHFASAAMIAMEAGFDAIEIHMGHGYLLSQFISPDVNRRTDEYGGTLTNRMRFPIEVLRACRKRCGPNFPITCKINLSDGTRSGLHVDECIQACRMLEDAGIDAIVLSGGYTSKTPFFLMRGDVPWRGMMQVEPNVLQKLAIGVFGPVVMKPYPFEENYFLTLARQVREATDVPLTYLGGIVSGGGIAEVMTAGFDMIGIGRALISDASFVHAVRRDPGHVSPCNHCNKCMVEMDRGGVRCVL